MTKLWRKLKWLVFFWDTVYKYPFWLTIKLSFCLTGQFTGLVPSQCTGSVTQFNANGIILQHRKCLQCFDAVEWVTGRPINSTSTSYAVTIDTFNVA